MGNHAQRIYIPTLIKMSKNMPMSVIGIDKIESKPNIEKTLEKKKLNLKTYFIKNLSNNLSKKTQKYLTKLAKSHDINGVIIATPPDCHKTYATWALENNFHILMDKPVTTRKHCSTSQTQAKKLVKDYKELVAKYESCYQQKKTVFMLNTQRRYEVGYLYVFKLIKEATDKFNIPVTSIQSMHADGVWIFPDEIVEQHCHNYYNGNGKCSHSGFHLFDIVWQFYRAGYVKNKFADSAEVFSSFIEPKGTLTQLNQSDYYKLFGKEYNNRKRKSDKQLRQTFDGYGENDTFSIVRLLNKGDNVCNISINLMHNSVSERNWVLPSPDLYKGNGRIKHQSYYIQQGPFQSIQIHNYQSKSKQEKNNASDYGVGGNNHFDIYVFRNPKMFGGDTKNFAKYSLNDLDINNELDDTRLYHETAKETIVKEFIDAILSKVRRKRLKIDIATYQIPVQIMSSIYQSNARYKNKLNPLVKFKINEKK